MNQQIFTPMAKTFCKSGLTENNVVEVKEPFVKSCKHSTVTGWCTRSNKQCPAIKINLSINK